MTQFLVGLVSRYTISFFVLLFSVLFVHSAQAGAIVPIPIFTKQFSPDSIGPGSVSTLTLSIDNSDISSPAEDIAFIDNLPQGMTLATPAFVSNNCSGTLNTSNGGSTITFNGGGVGAFKNCDIVVNVTAPEPSGEVPYNNTTGDLSSSAGNSGTASASLTVDNGLPGFSKSFAPDSVALGGRSTLTFIIDNTANDSNVANLDFTDNLPIGMIIADPANATTTCGTTVLPATLSATAGSTAITLDSNGVGSFPAVVAGATCTVTVDVIATGGGTLNNISAELLADSVTAGKASASLIVSTTPLAIQKSFTDDPVAPGGTVTLDFTLSNFDRMNPASAVAFSDDLTTAIAGLTYSSMLLNDCGGSVTGVGGTTIGFSGGAIAAGGSCTISTRLSVPPGAVVGIYTNTTSAITGTVDGSPVVGNMASEDLFVAPSPILTKEFLEVGTLAADPTVSAGDDVVLRFTISNPSTTSDSTEIEFIDELTDGSGGNPPDLTSGFLPFPVSVTLPPVPDPACGAGSSLALVSVGTDRQGLMLTGGSLLAGASCSFEVTLAIPTHLAPGVYTNTTEEPSAIIDGATRTGKVASDTLTVISAPSLTKSFIDDPTAPGGTVALEFTLTHPADATGDATNISFTDDLSALDPVLVGLIATGLPLEAACDPDGPGEISGTGNLSSSVGGTLLTLTDASLSPGESCTFNVTLDVPAGTVAGSYINMTSGVSATVAGQAATSAPASDDLQIAGLTFNKEFVTNPVLPGGTTILRFTIDNLHPTEDATITLFTDNLAANLSGLAATGGSSSDTCGGSLSGTTNLFYIGGSVLSGESCSIEVEVLVPVGTVSDDYLNVTSSLSANQGGASVSVNPATNTLTVNDNLLQLNKEFTDDPVAPGGSVNLRFTLTNLDQAQAASSINFSDDLDSVLSGLVATGLPVAACGGNVSGSSTINFTGGSLAAGAQCEFDVNVNLPASATANIFSNTTSPVTGTINATAVIGDPANDQLNIINLLQFSKAFDGPSTSSGTATLTFTITNPGTSAVTGISYNDDLNSVLSGLIASSLPVMPCGADSSITGTSLLNFTGGALPPMGGMCSFDVIVQIPVTESVGDFLNTTSDLLLNGINVSPPATANLTVEPAPTFNKVFAPNTVAVNGLNTLSTLTFTVDNSASALAVTALAFNDDLPAGLVIATPANASSTCTGGTVGAVSEDNKINYNNGSVAAGAICTITVNVINTTAGNKVNTTSNLISSSGDSGSGTDTLIVDAPPVITAPADVLNFEATGVNSSVSLGTPTITDVVDDDTSLNATPTPDGSSLALGETIITWTVIDSIGNSSLATQTISIVDTTPPSLIPPGNIIQEATATLTPVTLGVATVTDAVNSGLTATPNPTGPFPVGITTVIWSVTDDAGNINTATQTVTITDNTPPVITLNGANTIPLEFGDAPFTDPGATASDIVDGDLTSSIIPSGTVGAAPGTYPLTYTVTDNAGNQASETRTIIVNAINSFSNLLPSGLTGTLSFESTDTGCSFNPNSQAYIDVNGVTISPPPSLSFVDGLITFEIVNCSVGATVNVTMDYGQPLPANGTYWKEGTPYYQIPSTISGNTVFFSLTDGQLGDTDETANGIIRDPGGLAVLVGPQSIPTLSNWALMLLIMLLLSSMIYYQQRRID